MALSYFKKVETYQTYSGQESNLHYDFNANSGGGQAFLGGKVVSPSGNAIPARSLEGRVASFSLRWGGQLISLSDNGNGLYDISPRGAGSQSMKLGVQGKVNPNLLITAAMMLPRTCGRNMAASVTVSPLTIDNYWLRSMWLDVEFEGDDNAVFVPRDFIYEGGLSKRQGVTTEKNKVIGAQQFFQLGYEQRMTDIASLVSSDDLPEYAHDVLSFFSDIYSGTKPYEFGECSSMTADLMQRLSRDYCELYSGYSDPLEFLARLDGRGSGMHCTRAKRAEEQGPRNLIYFGAPGTGKSHDLNERVKRKFDKDNVRRVTFHPDYTYAQFVGSFKPYSDISKGNEISYRYMPGAFMDTYLDAVTHPDDNYVLIIEELNRANPAAVFGNVFQLLDRDASGNSEYAVETSKEMADSIGAYFDELSQGEKDALESHYDDVGYEDVRKMSMTHLRIPDNMYIWATMNSADQGVYPMDTAFKRRWDFEYLGIDEGESVVQEYIVPIGKTGKTASWNELRKAINYKLLEAKVNEDKLIGPFFIPPAVLADGESFNNVFKSKVLLYLYEDAAKTKRSSFFKGGVATYSQICEEYDRHGIEGIFDDVTVCYIDGDSHEGAQIDEVSGEEEL